LSRSTKLTRSIGAAAVALAAALTVAACGSSSTTSTPSSSSGSGSTGGSSTKTVNWLLGTPPQSLDPGLDYTTQGSEVNWLVYTGLTTYRRAAGTAGTQLIPGLTTALPVISDGGKTYTVTLRKGLEFSNGKAVKASDFTYTVERAIKVPWGGAGAFITPIIVGAKAYSAGKASTISGITTDDATGKIVIHLTAAYGPFDNVLAFPALGIIPSGSPMKVEPTSPPPGVGPYKVTNIVPNQSFDVVKNPLWSKMATPALPAGHENFDFKIDSNVESNALAVLNNTADIFDWADTLPGSLLGQIDAKASDRFKMVDLGGNTYYIFMNPNKPPFNNQLVREAVVTGLDLSAMNRLASGTLDAGCYFLPPAVPGHPTTPCPYGTPGNGNLAKAKALVKQSGDEGQAVTVWSEQRTPRLQWMTYYTQFLNQIGLKATLKEVSDSNYFTTIGEAKTVDPQTGFADWNQDFPNPVDFYGVLLAGDAIQPTDNENFGQVNDPHLNSVINKLGATPSTQLNTVVSQWQALDEYTAKKAYIAVFGYQKDPFFTSDRVDFTTDDMMPIYGWDLGEIKLK